MPFLRFTSTPFPRKQVDGYCSWLWESTITLVPTRLKFVLARLVKPLVQLKDASLADALGDGAGDGLGGLLERLLWAHALERHFTRS